MNNNIDDLIESKIDSIVNEKNIYHVGKVVRINAFVVEATGLDDAFFFEKVFIGDQENIGYVDKIEENKVIIALVKTNGNIKIGDLIKTSGEALEASFSKNAMGMVIDAFGTDRMSGKNFNDSKMIQVETPKIPIMDRTAVNRPLETGIAGIDMMFPIGRGQRQLIIGDKKTGKTQILLDTIVNQKGKNVICIYVSIGKTKKDIKRLYTKLVEKGANAYTMIVAAFNDDPSPMIKLTPYVGISIAEEYMMEGYDVLVCIDDLKKHADACREIALISEKNTGREAYPADIFYTHSRLLEKGCQHKNGGSITVLPVVETKGGDITDYISTNVISITDGQIVLDEKAFKKGQKPAIDFGLSVSRLGGAVQNESIKKIGARVRQELLSYLETADVYQLVKIDSMTKELQEKMKLGKKILDLLSQPKFAPRSEERMVESFKFILDVTGEVNEYKENVVVPNDVVSVPENVPVNEVVNDIDEHDVPSELAATETFVSPEQEQVNNMVDNFFTQPEGTIEENNESTDTVEDIFSQNVVNEVATEAVNQDISVENVLTEDVVSNETPVVEEDNQTTDISNESVQEESIPSGTIELVIPEHHVMEVPSVIDLVPTTETPHQEMHGFELAQVEQVVIDHNEEKKEVNEDSITLPSHLPLPTDTPEQAIALEMPVVSEEGEVVSVVEEKPKKETEILTMIPETNEFVEEPIIVVSKEIEELTFDEEDDEKTKEELLEMTRKMPIEEIQKEIEELSLTKTQKVPVKEIEILTEEPEEVPAPKKRKRTTSTKKKTTKKETSKSQSKTGKVE